MKIKQRILPNARLSDDIGIWEGFVVYKVLYFVFKAETIVDFMVGFLVEVTIFIKVSSKRQRIRHRYGI